MDANSDPEIRRSACPLDCPDTCSLSVTTAGGEVLKVRGSSDNPYTAGVICNKVARSYPEFVHGSGRLTHPLRRTGEKGAGQFETVSWDAALDQVHEGFSRAIARFGPQSVIPFNYAGPLGDISIDLVAVIAVAKGRAKQVGSTEGMERSRQTSPFHAAWLSQVELDLRDAEDALRSGDFGKLAHVVEGSCLAMHADAMAARPGIIYFGDATLWAMDRVRAMRKAGIPVFFTVDAGPHLVAFTTSENAGEVANNLGEHRDMLEVRTSAIGDGAHLIDRLP